VSVAYTGGLRQGQATLMPSLAEIAAVVTLQFPRITEHDSCFIHLYMWMGVLTCVRNNISLAAFKHFDPLVHTSLWQTFLHTWQPIVDGSLPLSFLHTSRNAVACCLSLVQTSSGAVIFTPCLLGANGVQLNHTRSMWPSDLELQHDQASAVMPMIQLKYCNIPLTFLISFVFIEMQAK
jgi:hypothetical protein